MAEGKAGKQPPRLKWPSKVLITRGILLFIGTISVLCFAIAIARFNLYLYALRGWNNNYEQGDMFDEMVIASISLSVLTTAVFFFHSIASPPLHPGYYVAGDVLSFVALTVCCILGFLLGPFTTYTNFVENSTCHAGPQHAFCEAEADLMQKLQIAGYSCGFLMVILHFTLFVIACYRTHVHNLRKEMSKINAEMRKQDMEIRRYTSARLGEKELPKYPLSELPNKKKFGMYKAELGDNDRRVGLREMV